MGDLRYQSEFDRIRDAPDPVGVIRSLADEQLIAALAAASREKDPYWANVLATEAQNRARQKDAITRTLGEGVYAIDRTGAVSFMNPAAAEATGLTSAEAIGCDIHEILRHKRADGGAIERKDCAVISVLQSGRSVRRDGEAFEHQDGRLIPISYTASPILRDGDVDGVVVVFRDVSDRVAAERALHAREQAFRAVAENSPDIISRFDRELRHVYVNPAVWRAVGRTPDDFLGRTHAELGVPQELQDIWTGVLRRVFETGEETSLRFSYDGPAGRTHYHSRLVPEFDENGSVASVLAIARDVTELMRAESAVLRRLELEHAVASITARLVNPPDLDHAIESSLADIGRAAAADRAYLFLLRADGAALDNTHEWCAPGIEPQKDALQDFPASEAGWWMANLDARDVVHVPDVSALPPEAQNEKAILTSLGVKSLVTIALRVRGRLAGFIGCDDVTHSTAWADEDVSLLGIVARSIGLALERRHDEDELRARARQQEAVAHLGQVAIASPDLQRLLDEAAAVVADTLGVQYSKVLELLPSGETLVLRAAAGWDRSLVGSATVRAGKESQVGYTLHANAPVIVEDLAREQRFSGPSLITQEGLVSGLSVVVAGEDAPFGVLGVHSRARRHFSRDDVAFVQSVANVIASAVRQERARASVEAAARRNGFLARAQAALGSTLEPDAALAAVARAAVAEFADWAVAFALDDDGALRRVASAHADPEKEREVQALVRDYPPNPGARVGPAAVVRTGTTEFVRDVTDDLLVSAAVDAEHLRRLRGLGVRSVITVPIKFRRGTLGALSVVAADSGRVYEAADVAVLEDLAARAGAALENARLYSAERDARRRAWGALAALRESEAYVGGIMEAVEEGIGIVEPPGRFVFLNAAGRRLLGVGADDSLGDLSSWRPTRPDGSPLQEHERPSAVASKSGRPVRDAVVSITRPDGTRRVVSVNAIPMTGPDAKSGRIIVSFRDVTERHRRNEDLNRHHERVSLISKATNDALWDWDASADDLWWGAGVRSLFGYEAEDVAPTFAAWLELVHPEDRERVEEGIRDRFRRGEETWSDEYRFRRKDGSFAVVHDRGFIAYADGKPMRVVGSMMDVTAQRHAEDEVLRLKRLHEDIVQNVPAGVLYLDPSGVITFENRQLVSMLGGDGSAPAALGRSIFELPTMRGHEGFLDRVRGMLTGAAFRDHEITYRSLYGKDAVLSVSGVPIVDDDSGAVKGGILLARDLADREVAQEEVRRLNMDLERRVRDRTQELAAANRELEAFSYSVSHDLRAPLRAVDYLSQAILEDYGDEFDREGRSYLEKLRAESRRMTQLVNDLLALSRASTEDVRRSRIDLSAIASSVAADLRSRDQERDVAIDVEDGVEAHADPRLMRVVLENLIGNAWKFTSRTKEPRIEFGVRHDAERAGPSVFFVRDNGAGFDMTQAGRLFQAFQRLHTNTEFEGTGIGLATVHRIVRRHGGRVWAEGRPGEGATFFFTLTGS